MAFNGFSEETYRFFMELRYNNNKEFFHANEDRYRKFVRTPMTELVKELLPTMLAIDPGMDTRMMTIVSRMNRDTRFSKNKLPYRDHMWFGTRDIGKSVSECYVLYAEISPEGYGYGMGMWDGNREIMNPLRERILAKPNEFLELVNDKRLDRFIMTGDSYKKDKIKDAPEELKPYLNLKSIGFTYSSPMLKRTFTHEFKDEIEQAFIDLSQLYRFIKGL